MAHLAIATTTSSSQPCICFGSSNNAGLEERRLGVYFAGKGGGGGAIVACDARRRVTGAVRSTASANAPVAEAEMESGRQVCGIVQIPVSCYQILGVSEKAEKDEIVKAVMELKRSEIEDGYTTEVSSTRQDLLMDVRDKLLFEQEYAGNIKEKIPPRSSLQLPWNWLPAALCILQEVGEEGLVLEIGRAALQRSDSKPYVHDVLLAMALAECSIAKTYFEKSKVSYGFEALARSQYLLRSKISLGNMPLLAQIEESLEELAPACTLEILSLPHTPDNAERRRGAIAALRELLRQGLDVESSCRVNDWPCFLNQALNKLLGAEIVDLLSWDTLAMTRRNKKSLESQSQRVVVDFDCFYIALIAHVAFGFSTRQIDMISKAKVICECLIVSESVDLKFEESFCLYLLGQETGAVAFEKLQKKLQVNGSSNSRNYGLAKNKEGSDKASVDRSLEQWLKDAVLSLFPDTRDCSPSLVNFFGAPKRTLSNSKQKLGTTRTVSSSSQALPFTVRADNRTSGEQTPRLSSITHLGEAVKQLAPSDLAVQSSWNKPANSTSATSVPLKRNPGLQDARTCEAWDLSGELVGKLAYTTLLGLVLFGTLKLLSLQFGHIKVTHKLHRRDSAGTLSANQQSSSHGASALITDSIRNQLVKLSKLLRINNKNSLRNKESVTSWCPDDDLSPVTNVPSTVLHDQKITPQEAAALVKQWQDIKSEALGPNYRIDMLGEILDESMLLKWQDLVKSAKSQSCFWRFVLLDMSVVRAEILSDEAGGDIAEIEAVLEEAAELIDDSHPKKPSYYSTYEVQYTLKRQRDGSWRICEGVVRNLT